MRVVLTREAGRNAALRPWLPPDAQVVEVPLTSTERLGDAALTASLGAEHAAHWIVVTSARAVFAVATALATSPSARVAAVGDATARALRDGGVRVDAVGDGPAATLTNVLDGGPVVILGARDGRPELADALRARGVAVTTVACYATVPRALDESARATLGAADVVFIGAPSAWAVARDAVPPRALVVVPGPTTAAAVRHDHDRLLEGWDASLRDRLVRAI